jgi:pimeloyl-ACP methyl ester carboxylesterase
MRNSIILQVLILSTLCGGCTGLPDKHTLQMDGYEIAYAQRGAGKPAVIFEAGFASGMDNWKQVFKPVSKLTTAFAYDRKGIGKSHPTDNKETAGELVPEIFDAVVPGAGGAIDVLRSVGAKHQPTSRDGEVIIEELRRMLTRLNISPPYILVGHSLGGMYMELYSRTYPQEIAGLVLVDPRRADFTAKCKAAQKADNCDLPAWLLHLLPEATVAEYRGAEATAALMANAGSLPEVPTVVLTAYNGTTSFSTEQKALWLASHDELTHEAPHIEHIVLKESGHFIQHDHPQIVIDAIRSVIRQSRAHDRTATLGSLPKNKVNAE